MVQTPFKTTSENTPGGRFGSGEVTALHACFGNSSELVLRTLQSSPGSKLPLLLRREPLPLPGTEGLSIVPAHVQHGVIQPVLDAGAWAWGLAGIEADWNSFYTVFITKGIRGGRGEKMENGFSLIFSQLGLAYTTHTSSQHGEESPHQDFITPGFYHTKI